MVAFYIMLARRVGLKSDGTDDGTLSRPRICKLLYVPSQGDETGDWTDDGIGLLHVIRLCYSTVSGGQTSTLRRDSGPWRINLQLSRHLTNRPVAF